MSRPTWRGIVKVQRELAPHRDRSILVTSARGAIYYRGRMRGDVKRWLGRRLKRYCRATLRDTIINLNI